MQSSASNNLIFLDTIESTNEYLLKGPGSELPSGSGCLARMQTSGLGRLNRKWISPVGGMYLSVLHRPESPVSKWPLLSFVSALSIRSALEELYPDLPIRFKWPNDLLCHNFKIGGILLQTILGNNSRIVTGIGLNINTPIDQLPNRPLYPAASLIQWTNKTTKINELALLVMRKLNRYYSRWEIDTSWIIPEWLVYTEQVGSHIDIMSGDDLIHGMFKGVDSKGALLLETADNKIVSLNQGEILGG